MITHNIEYLLNSHLINSLVRIVSQDLFAQGHERGPAEALFLLHGVCQGNFDKEGD